MQNDLLSHRTNNITVKFDLMKDKVRDKSFSLHYVPTGEMAVDVLTKVMAKGKNCANQRLLGMGWVQ